VCGCDKHSNRRAECTCLCKEHRNFDLAYKLAMERLTIIQELHESLEQARAELNMIAEMIRKES